MCWFIFWQVRYPLNIETNLLRSMMMGVLMKWMMLMFITTLVQNPLEKNLIPSSDTVTSPQKG